MERSDQSFEPSTPASTHVGEGAVAQLTPLGPDELSREAIAALKARPRFAEAWKTAHIGFIDLWQGNRLLNTLVNDRGRWQISQFAVRLHMLSRPNDPHSGLTVSRMTALCVEQKFCSAGRAKAMLMLMRAFGYLAPSPNDADRRLRRLVPTERLMALHRDRILRLFRAIAMVLPECAEPLSAQSHPDFTARFVCRYCEHFLSGFRLIDGIPDMRLFVDHNAGIMILSHMMLSGEADDVYPPTVPVAVSLSTVSRRFGVSRAHVRRLLQRAEKQGLLERLEGDRIRLLPRLVQAAGDLIAVQFLVAAHCAQGALADIDRESAA
jgi:DNA-binding MarR family transcriptional regulator